MPTPQDPKGNEVSSQSAVTSAEKEGSQKQAIRKSGNKCQGDYVDITPGLCKIGGLYCIDVVAVVGVEEGKKQARSIRHLWIVAGCLDVCAWHRTFQIKESLWRKCGLTAQAKCLTYHLSSEELGRRRETWIHQDGLKSGHGLNVRE